MEKEFEVVARYLVPGEWPLRVWRHHWLWCLRRVTLPTALFLIFLGIAQASEEGTMYLAALVPLLVSVLVTVHWRRRVVFLSNQRVGEVGGLLASIQESDNAWLTDVQNIDVRRPGAKALLGWNDYNIQTGSGNIPLVGYPSGLDKSIWDAKAGNFLPPTQRPPSSQPPSQGGGTIIVH